MQIANIVDDEAEGKGSLVLFVGEVAGDLVSVVVLRGSDFTLQELCQAIKGTENIVIRLSEAEIVKSRAWLIQVWLVGEVPAALEGVALTLDAVSEGRTLSEGVVLLLYEAWVVDLERLQLVQSGIEHVRVGLLKNGLGLSCNQEMSGAPEGICGGKHGSEGSE